MAYSPTRTHDEWGRRRRSADVIDAEAGQRCAWCHQPKAWHQLAELDGKQCCTACAPLALEQSAWAFIEFSNHDREDPNRSRLMDRLRREQKRGTLRLQYIRCGKPLCRACRVRGHGPYWYAFTFTDGKTRSRYIGKRLKLEGAGDNEHGDDEGKRNQRTRAAAAKAKPPARRTQSQKALAQRTAPKARRAAGRRRK